MYEARIEAGLKEFREFVRDQLMQPVSVGSVVTYVPDAGAVGRPDIGVVTEIVADDCVEVQWDSGIREHLDKRRLDRGHECRHWLGQAKVIGHGMEAAQRRQVLDMMLDNCGG